MTRFIIASLLFAISLYASVINVPADQATIQGGLDNAGVGDTIMVQAGIYYENLIWPVSNFVTLIGSGSQGCIIDGSDAGSVIQISNGSATIVGFRLQHGLSNYGGGVNCIGASLFLEDITISSNHAEIGGGIFCTDGSTMMFSQENLCNIYDNGLTSGIWGMDIHSYTLLEVHLDTFTVGLSTEMFAFPQENIEIFSQNSLISQVDADLYVSELGNDSNTGQSPADPLKTIFQAFKNILPDPLNPNTIHLLNGVYSPSSNGERFPVNILHGVNLIGESKSGVILNAEGQANVISFNHAGSPIVSSMTITGGSAGFGAGIYCEVSHPILSDILVCDNSAENGGGGIGCSGSRPQLSRIIFQNNTAPYGGAISCSYSYLVMDRVSIVQNTASIIGGGIYFSALSSMVITNSIIWYNRNNNVSYAPDSVNSWMDISYSNIEGGVEGIENDNWRTWWGSGNLTVDPLFVSVEDGNLNLTDSSPCIDAGDPNSPLDPDSTHADMGALYYPHTITDLITENVPVQHYLLQQNLPNPFNPSTTISYGLPEDAAVSLVIYDIRGNTVRTIDSGSQVAGWYERVWNGMDESGQPVSTGLYLTRLQAGSYSKTIKMLYLK